MSSKVVHPNNLCPYIISYYYRIGVSTNDPDFDSEENLSKFVTFAIKTGLYALVDKDSDKHELTVVGDIDPSTRLLFVQHHAGSLEYPITTMSKPIVKLGGGRHYEFVTAGGTYEPHNTHRAVVKMRENRGGLLHYKWSWTEETEDGTTYISGVIYCDLVKLTEEEYEACLRANMPEFDLLAVLQNKRLKYREVDPIGTDNSPMSERAEDKKRKRGSMLDTVSALFSSEKRGKELPRLKGSE